MLLRITSRDVIHSFWIPTLNGKRDAVPGRVHTLRMQADEPGIYAGQCTEFCGLCHANMRMEAVAPRPPPTSTTWVGNQLEPYAAARRDGTLAADGEDTFIAQCVALPPGQRLWTRTPTATPTPVLANPDLYVVVRCGAEPHPPDDPHTFAGATFDLLTDECRDRLWNASPDEFGALYLQGVTPECLNEVELREWLRNAPAKKPMYAEPDKLEADRRQVPRHAQPQPHRDQIDELIAYLLERK